MSVSEGKKLKEILKEKGTVVLPGAVNCLEGRIIKRMGFDAIHMSGFGAEVDLLGYPDMGFSQSTEIADVTGRIYDATGLPIIADADVAWGDVLATQRTIHLLEKAGAAGCHIEDQAMPMKCAGMKGLKYVSKEKIVSKIKAALDARTDPDFIIIGRTDVYAGKHDYQETLDRLYALEEAGADMLEAGGAFPAELWDDLTSRFPHKLCLPSGLYPYPGFDIPTQKWIDRKLGFLFYPQAAQMASAKAIEIAMEQIKKGVFTEEFCKEHFASMEELNEIVDAPYYFAKEAEFAAD